MSVNPIPFLKQLNFFLDLSNARKLGIFSFFESIATCICIYWLPIPDLGDTKMYIFLIIKKYRVGFKKIYIKRDKIMRFKPPANFLFQMSKNMF